MSSRSSSSSHSLDSSYSSSSDSDSDSLEFSAVRLAFSPLLGDELRASAVKAAQSFLAELSASECNEESLTTTAIDASDSDGGQHAGAQVAVLLDCAEGGFPHREVSPLSSFGAALRVVEGASESAAEGRLLVLATSEAQARRLSKRSCENSAVVVVDGAALHDSASRASLLAEHGCQRVLLLSDGALDAQPGDGSATAPLTALALALETAHALLHPAAWVSALASGDDAAVLAMIRRHGAPLLRLKLDDPRGLDTALHVVAHFGHTSLVAPLVAHGSPLNVFSSSTGYTPLHVASARGHADTVRALVLAGASVDSRARLSLQARVEQRIASGSRFVDSPLTPLELACDGEHWNAVAAIAALAPASAETLLRSAVRTHDVKRVGALLERAGLGVTNTLLEALVEDAEAPHQLLKLLVEHAKTQQTVDIKHELALKHENDRR